MDEKIRLIVEDAARRHGLPFELVAAIIAVESSDNPWASRFEPAFFRRYIQNNPDIRAISPCSLDTEKMLRATSFGPMQVMGQVARERGFKGPYLTQLCEPRIGIEYGCIHLAAFARKFGPLGWAAVCAAYNGGAGAVRGGDFTNPEYPAKVLRNLPGQRWPG